MPHHTSFDERIVRYEEIHDVRPNDFAALVEAADIKDCQRILDCGSGYGAVAREVLKITQNQRRKNGDLIAIDLVDESPVQLKRAQEELKPWISDPSVKLTFHEGLFPEHFNWNKRYDVAIAKMVLHEVPPAKQADFVAGLYDCLKDDGQLLIWDVCLPGEAVEFFRKVIKAKDQLAGFTSLVERRHFLSKPELLELLSKSRFSFCKEVKRLGYTLVTENRLKPEFRGNKSLFQKWQKFIREAAKDVPPEVLKVLQYRDDKEDGGISFRVSKSIFSCRRKERLGLTVAPFKADVIPSSSAIQPSVYPVIVNESFGEGQLSRVLQSCSALVRTSLLTRAYGGGRELCKEGLDYLLNSTIESSKSQLSAYTALLAWLYYDRSSSVGSRQIPSISGALTDAFAHKATCAWMSVSLSDDFALQISLGTPTDIERKATVRVTRLAKGFFEHVAKTIEKHYSFIAAPLADSSIQLLRVAPDKSIDVAAIELARGLSDKWLPIFEKTRVLKQREELSDITGTYLESFLKNSYSVLVPLIEFLACSNRKTLYYILPPTLTTKDTGRLEEGSFVLSTDSLLREDVFLDLLAFVAGFWSGLGTVEAQVSAALEQEEYIYEQVRSHVTIEQFKEDRAGSLAIGALKELRGKPDVALFDCSGDEKNSQRINTLTAQLTEKGFFVSQAILPKFPSVQPHQDCQIDEETIDQEKHLQSDDEKLLCIVEYELSRLPRPLCAIVVQPDKTGETRITFQRIERLVETVKETLPIFPDRRRLRLAENLWPNAWDYEGRRYEPPPRALPPHEFLVGTSPNTVTNREQFVKQFKLSESDLRPGNPHRLIQLFRALVPKAEKIEILVMLGGGRSNAETPLVVRGKTAKGRWLRPVQIKFSHDWRGLAKERKGYRDVFKLRLGPAIAHALEGPYRNGDWSGMAQSFAAPEEAITNISSRRTRTLKDFLEQHLGSPETCKKLVNAVFDGVLEPFYGKNLSRQKDSVYRAFVRVTPPHLETTFYALGDEEKLFVFNPQHLSRKDERTKREECCRKWQAVEETLRDGKRAAIEGLIIDSLETDKANPLKHRLRVWDQTLGIKVDLFPNNSVTAEKWAALCESPIKLRGLPITFVLDPTDKRLREAFGQSSLFGGWGRTVKKCLDDAGVWPSDKWSTERISYYFHPWHPLDWSEEFTIGPTHGDLNLGNILLHERDGGFFPWLIDFDQAKNDEPIVFDLVKLEIEAYHTIGYKLFWELWEHGCVANFNELERVVRNFECCLESADVDSIDHLWKSSNPKQRKEERPRPPAELQRRLNGFLTYLKAVRERVYGLGVTEREFLIGRTVYCMTCLKFKHLYRADGDTKAPFPARILFYKLQWLLEKLDEGNGISPITADGKTNKLVSKQQRLVHALLREIRSRQVTVKSKGRKKKTTQEALITLLRRAKALGPFFQSVQELPRYSERYSKDQITNKLETVFRLLRDSQVAGERRWFREVLWYVRDHSIADNAGDLGRFILAMVLASKEADTWCDLRIDMQLTDYASTGGLANAYPTQNFFEHLANRKLPFVKISSRGDSGGTIDMLEDVGVDICRSVEAVKARIKSRDKDHQWAVAATSADLCEIDKIMMEMRKECNCMKVDDLVIASISAKKLSVGIGTFQVRLSGGYDSKFQSLKENSDSTTQKRQWNAERKRIEQRWNIAWNAARAALGYRNRDKYVSLGQVFDSTALFKANHSQPVICGNTLLGAHIWRALWGDPDDLREEKALNKEQRALKRRRETLKNRLGGPFSDRITELSSGLEKLIRELEREELGAIFEVKLPLARTTGKTTQCVVCYRKESFQALSKELGGLQGLVFRFPHDESNNFDYRETICVPYFDGLFSRLHKGGHPMTSFIFEKTWFCILCPESEMPADTLTWAWEILREGLDVWESK